MKSSPLVHLAACFCIPAWGAELPVKSVAMRDVMTHDQIVEAARKAKEEEPPSVFQPTEGADPSVANKPVDILKRSDIFSYHGRATLVPKRAILHVPKALSDRLGMKDGSALIPWIDFFNENRAWIRTVSVSRVQAEGNESLPEATLKSFEKETRIVVATFQQGPISILPLKISDPAASATGAANRPAINVVKP